MSVFSIDTHTIILNRLFFHYSLFLFLWTMLVLVFFFIIYYLQKIINFCEVIFWIFATKIKSWSAKYRIGTIERFSVAGDLVTLEILIWNYPNQIKLRRHYLMEFNTSHEWRSKGPSTVLFWRVRGMSTAWKWGPSSSADSFT